MVMGRGWEGNEAVRLLYRTEETILRNVVGKRQAKTNQNSFKEQPRKTKRKRKRKETNENLKRKTMMRKKAEEII